MNRRKIVILLIGFFIIVGSVLLMDFLGSQKEPPEKKPKRVANKYVRTDIVKYSEIDTEVTAYGRVRTAESLDLIAEVSGRMYQGKVPMKEGQKFSRGALLFRIDDTEPRLNLQAQKSNFLRDIAAILPDIKIDFNDSYQQWNTYFNAIDIEKPLPKLPEFKTGQEKTFLATKNIFSNYYTIKSLEANLQKHYFYAPFNGNVSLVNLQSGSYVNPGNNIGRIIRSNKLELKVTVETKDISWIRNGELVSIQSEDGNSNWNGTIIRIGEFVNENTQSIDVFVALQPNENTLYDGQYLKAVIPAKKIEHGMVIPRNAIFNGNEVFVLQDTLLKVRQVTVHKLNPETAIFSGLEEGSQLVIEPLVNAHNNMKAFKLEEDEVDKNFEKKVSDTKKIEKQSL